MPQREMVVLGLLFWACATLSGPRACGGEKVKTGTCRVLVVAFVGGLGAASFPPTVAGSVLHEVQSVGGSEVCVKRVSSYWPWSATHWVKEHLSSSGKQRGASKQVTTEPKIIAFGYSLGVPHELGFARALERQGIPIELLVAVDSKGFTDGVIPANVKMAANYYERDLYPLFFPLYYGKANLFPEDSRKTDFLGNFLVLHTGHFTIVTVSPIRDLLVNEVRALLGKDWGEIGAPLSKSNRPSPEPHLLKATD